MTTQEILTVVFGIPAVTLLGGIFYRLGFIKSTVEEHGKDIKALWDSHNSLKDLFHGLSV